jgi:DNA-binding CsgD family transcriptional regulator/PAS domain-containing protein
LATSTRSDKVAHQLIGLIYESAVDPNLWQEFLKQFADAIGSTTSTLFFQDHDSRKGEVSVAHRYDPFYLRQYEVHFSAVNVWLQRLANQTRSGDIRNTLDACSNSELVRTEYYNDWLRPQDLFFGYGGTIFRNGAVTTNIAAMRSRRAGPFGKQETALLQLLMPHLQRAIQLHRRLATAEAERNSSLEALEHLAAGVILTKANGQVLFRNRAARQIVDRKDGLHIGSAGLSAASSRETKELRKLTAEAGLIVSGLPTHESRGMMTVSRPSARRPLFLLVVPLCVDYARRQLLSAGEIPTALILISDPEADLTPDSADLQRSFALTRAEARFASALMGGKSVEEAAAELRITIHTARTHLKRILSKTGTRRQGELIHLLLKSFAQLRSTSNK